MDFLTSLEEYQILSGEDISILHNNKQFIIDIVCQNEFDHCQDNQD